MKSSHIKLCILNIILLVLSLLNILIFNIDNFYVISAILLVFVFITKLLVGYEKTRTRFLRDILMVIFIYIMVYILLTYLSGIFVGFLRTGYNLSILGILKNIMPFIIAIAVTEVLRYMIVKKSTGNLWLIVLTTITLTAVDLLFIYNIYNIVDAKDIVNIVALSIVPTISKNILLTYIALNFGYGPNIFYRYLLELYVFIVPIFPDFNEYIQAVLLFIVPIVIMALIAKTYGEKLKKKESTLKKRHFSNIASFVIIIIMILNVCLVSGMFRYYALSIGSGSMEPTIYKGDVVVVRKYDQEEMKDIKVGDVLIFEMYNKIVVHRVEEINKTGEEYSFITKGDNNDELDNWIVLEENVIGVAKFTIKYIGLPTIWLNEMIE